MTTVKYANKKLEKSGMQMNEGCVKKGMLICYECKNDVGKLYHIIGLNKECGVLVICAPCGDKIQNG